jgi:hypothetical protein
LESTSSGEDILAGFSEDDDEPSMSIITTENSIVLTAQRTLASDKYCSESFIVLDYIRPELTVPLYKVFQHRLLMGNFSANASNLYSGVMTETSTILRVLVVFFSPSMKIPEFIYLWLYSPCGPWPRVQFLNLYTVGRTLGRGISLSQGRYLYTVQHKHRINTHGHPYLEWDSNPRSQCSSKRK